DFQKQAMPQTQIRLQLRPAQIEIAILQTQVFSRQRVVRSIKLKWQRPRIVQNHDFSRLHFDVAGDQLWIASGFVAHDNFTGHRQNVFTTHVLGFRVRRARVFLIHHHLGDAIAIAQIDESQWTKVAPAPAPAHQDHSLAGIFFSQRAAGMRALKTVKVFDHKKNVLWSLYFELRLSELRRLAQPANKVQSSKHKVQSTKYKALA